MNYYFDVRKFISEVEKRPCLWDVNLKEYLQKLTKIEAWKELCAVMFADYDSSSLETKREREEELQKKWKGIRSSFAREIQKVKRDRQGSNIRNRRVYVHFDQLSFLLPFKTEKKTTPKKVVKSDDVVEEEEEEEEEEQETSRDSLPCNEATAEEPEEPAEETEEPAEVMAAEPSIPQQPSGKRKISIEFDQELNLFRKLSKTFEPPRPEEDHDDCRHFLLSLIPSLKKVPGGRMLECRMKIMKVIREYEKISE